MKKQTKKRNAQDLTLRNLRAWKKKTEHETEMSRIMIYRLFDRLAQLEERFYNLENASKPKTKRR